MTLTFNKNKERKEATHFHILKKQCQELQSQLLGATQSDQIQLVEAEREAL
jgi:hypothetical protein